MILPHGLGLIIGLAAIQTMPPQAVTAQPDGVPAATTVTTTSAPSTSAAALLSRAEGLFENMEYPAVVLLTEEILLRPDATLAQRQRAYVLQGSALAVVADPVDAQRPFRFLLRADPLFELPPDTPPKILAVFRMVQVEEKALAQQLRETERQRLIDDIRILGELPLEVAGGPALPLEFFVRDPHRVVDGVDFRFRRQGEPSYSALALHQRASGAWAGELPAGWSDNHNGFIMQYYVRTLDQAHEQLATLGAMDAPLNLRFAPGSLAENIPVYRSPWFWAAAAGVTALVAGGVWLYVDRATALPDADYHFPL